MDARLVRLRVYPFKSLDGADVAAASLVAPGTFARDREFRLVDAEGTVVNGKREPLVHALRVAYDLALTAATFSSARVATTFTYELGGDTRALEAWLSAHFGRAVFVERAERGGFPDDTAAYGPTIVSRATLEAVASWFPGLSAAGMNLRIRANMEVDGVAAFWEDGLFSPGAPPFAVGGARFVGAYPCARCIVPSRDPLTGEERRLFAKRLAERRAATLPPWAARERFDHYFGSRPTRPLPRARSGKASRSAISSGRQRRRDSADV